ncbi:VWA domain-containing protein [Chondromyces apiculatus]|uniref:VWA domain-containing protein n=1 Tax=Chondromyces apiculatus TaxID=51 RepID=UPI0005C64A68|nr:VWA domain-containing protein [Chondromyces apiculatus]
MALASGSPEASAYDDVQGLRSVDLVETTHQIDLAVDHGHASLVVRRTVFNGGPRHDQATFFLPMPEGAVATSLASLGVKDGHPFWFRGELMEAEAAAAKYQELTGVGGFYPKDPALLSWRHQGLLALQVFPCAPDQPKTVEYTLRLPTTYRGGRHHLRLPRLGTETLSPVVMLSPARKGDQLFVAGRPVQAGAALALTAEETEIALAPRATREIEGALAAVPVGKERSLVQFQFDTPAKLSELPRNARVVVVIDGSRSLSEEKGKAGIAAVKAYLGHLPDALVQVITFDRVVRPQPGGFVSSAAARSTLDRLTLEPRNGSRLDDALARADALLAGFPRSLPRRIVVVTDLLTRSTLTPDRVGALVKKSGALVHVGLPSEGAPELARDDEHAWAAPIRATGGLIWRASTSQEAEDAAEMRRVYEEWARPVRLDKVAVEVSGFALEEGGFPEQLPEGEGVEHHGIHAAKGPVTEVALRGELWASPVRKVLRPEVAHGKLWSALVFGSNLLGDLSEEEMMPLAMRGGAVSPVTSYLAIEPGVRPSTEGIEPGEAAGGMVGAGSVGLNGFGRGMGSGGGIDPMTFLRKTLGAAFQSCPAGPRSATVTLETTLDEVVEVPAIQVDGAADAAVSRCLEEATWGLDLPFTFKAAWTSYVVRLAR